MLKSSLSSPYQEPRLCRVCGKKLKKLEGVMVECRPSSGGWKEIDIPLCSKHQVKVWDRVKEALGE